MGSSLREGAPAGSLSRWKSSDRYAAFFNSLAVAARLRNFFPGAPALVASEIPTANIPSIVTVAIKIPHSILSPPVQESIALRSYAAFFIIRVWVLRVASRFVGLSTFIASNIAIAIIPKSISIVIRIPHAILLTPSPVDSRFSCY